MTNSGYELERDTAIEAVREAALLCRAVQEQISPDVLEKKDRSPVTVADFGSQALVCKTIRTAFPDDPIIGEEDAAALRGEENRELLEKITRHVRAYRPEADNDVVCSWIDQGGSNKYSNRFWTLDPIDGTKGFLRREQYAVALALIVNGQIAVAALACPNLGSEVASSDEAGSIYVAVRGHGAMSLPLEGSHGVSQVRVSSTSDTAQARFCESVESGHSSHNDAAEVASILGIKTSPVRLDSQAKYAVVARGEADIYLRLPTRAGYVERIWDHAAGVLVVTEAGGKVTDVTGKPLAFTHGRGLEENRGVVVTNGLLHDEVIAAVKQAGVK